jgi:hypothetical protein
VDIADTDNVAVAVDIVVVAAVAVVVEAVEVAAAQIAAFQAPLRVAPARVSVHKVAGTVGVLELVLALVLVLAPRVRRQLRPPQHASQPRERLQGLRRPQ